MDSLRPHTTRAQTKMIRPKLTTNPTSVVARFNPESSISSTCLSWTKLVWNGGKGEVEWEMQIRDLIV